MCWKIYTLFSPVFLKDGRKKVGGLQREINAFSIDSVEEKNAKNSRFYDGVL